MSKTASPERRSNLRTGVIFAIAAQLIWGVFPLYLKLLQPTPAVAIVAHRVLWSFCFLILLVLLASSLRLPGLPKWSDLRAVFGTPKTLLWLFCASLLILGNWLGFVAAVALDRTMDASVGYYICPQVVMLLGVIFQKETLSKSQWTAFGCTSLGVLAMAASTAGIPWFGLMVAFSFGFYALTKKRIDCAALTSLTFETGILLLPAAAFLVYQITMAGPIEAHADPTFVSSWLLNLLLMLTGVITILPLAFYVESVKRIPLSLVGLLQYIGPTIQFGLSVFVLGDPFDWPRVIGIMLIWAGVIQYLRSMRASSQAER